MNNNNFIIGALAVAAIALFGCNKVEQAIDTPKENSFPFEFIASNIETKTTNDGLHTYWKSGDKVNLFHAVAGSTTYVSDGAFAAGADGASVTFSGTLASELTADYYDWYAIYPQNDNITTPANSGEYGYVTIGSAHNSSQTQTGNNSKTHLAGTRYPVAGKVASVAKASKPAITLSHLTSVVAVHVTNGTGAPITVSEVSFTGTEDIIGKYFIDFVNTPVVYTAYAGNVSSTAVLNVTSGAAIDPGSDATFYLAIKPFTAPNAETISLSVTADNGAQVRNKVLTADASFVAGTINTLNFTYDKAAPSIPEPTSKTGWYRVEKADWLVANDRVVIVNADGTQAMSKVQKSSNRDGVAITVEDDDAYKHITSLHSDSQVFILETGTVSGSFAYWCENGDEANKYIYAASSSSNQLKSSFTLNDNASFIATIPEGVGNLTAQGSYTRKVMQFNSSLFSCYEGASYTNISIYKYYGVWAGSTTCATPTISQDGALITISSTTPGATIYYTIDGSTPTSGSTKYTAPFSLAASTTVKAIAIRSHYTDSDVASQACTAKVATPVISSSANAFTITCATPGVTIYYEVSTIDLASVATPTTSSATYSTSVGYDATTYVKAYAVKDGYDDSEVASATCTYSGGSQVTLQYTTNTTTNMTGSNDAATLGLDEEKWSVVAVKGGGSNFPGLNKAGDIRLYYHAEGSNTITVTALETGVTITSITITYTSSDYNNGKVLVGGNPVAISDGAYPINSTSFVVTNGNTSNTQVRISKIVISYTTSI